MDYTSLQPLYKFIWGDGKLVVSGPQDLGDFPHHADLMLKLLHSGQALKSYAAGYYRPEDNEIHYLNKQGDVPSDDQLIAAIDKQILPDHTGAYFFNHDSSLPDRPAAYFLDTIEEHLPPPGNDEWGHHSIGGIPSSINSDVSEKFSQTNPDSLKSIAPQIPMDIREMWVVQEQARIASQNGSHQKEANGSHSRYNPEVDPFSCDPFIYYIGYPSTPLKGHEASITKKAEWIESWVYDAVKKKVYTGHNHIDIIPEIPDGWEKAEAGKLICGWYEEGYNDGYDPDGQIFTTIATDTVDEGLANENSPLAVEAQKAAMKAWNKQSYGSHKKEALNKFVWADGEMAITPDISHDPGLMHHGDLVDELGFGDYHGPMAENIIAGEYTSDDEPLEIEYQRGQVPNENQLKELIRTTKPIPYYSHYPIPSSKLSATPQCIYVPPTESQEGWQWSDGRIPFAIVPQTGIVYYGDAGTHHNSVMNQVMEDTAGGPDSQNVMMGNLFKDKWRIYNGDAKNVKHYIDALKNHLGQQKEAGAIPLYQRKIPFGWDEEGYPFIYSPENKRLHIGSENGYHYNILQGLMNGDPEEFKEIYQSGLRGRYEPDTREYFLYSKNSDPHLEDALKEHFHSPITQENENTEPNGVE